MATRSLLSKPTKTFSSLLHHSFSPISTVTTASGSLPSFSLLHRLRLISSLWTLGFSNSRSFSTRTRSNVSSLNDPSPNLSNRPPKESILLDGCDFEHWLVVVDKPESDPTRDEIIDGYIKTLAQVVGSEDEARKKIYSVSTRCYFAFGALVSEDLSYKLKELPNVRWVLPDSYLDVRNKDYGGEPFIDGRAVPYDPKYHEEWIRNNARANERNKRNDRPRSGNIDRRRENMQNRGFQRNSSTQPNHGMQNASSSPMAANQGMQNSPSNMGVVPNSPMSTPPQSQPQPQTMTGVPSHPNVGGLPQPGNMGRGGMQQNNNQPQPPNNYRAQPPNNYAPQPQHNHGAQPTNNYAPQPQHNNGPQPPNNYAPQPQHNNGAQPPNNYASQPQHNYAPQPQPQQNYRPQPQNNYGVLPPNSGMGAGFPPTNSGMGGAMQQPNNGYNGMAPRSNSNGGGMPTNAGWSGNGSGNQQNYQNGPNNGGGAPYQESAGSTGYRQNYTPTRD